jgi:hypothetical protein
MSFFDRFRSTPAPAATPQPPAELVPPRFLIEAEFLSDVGCVREHNEDCVSILRERNNSRGDRVLLVVADGMGGHNAGEVASAAAIATLENAFAKMRSEPAAHLKNACLDSQAVPRGGLGAWHGNHMHGASVAGRLGLLRPRGRQPALSHP